MYTNSTCTGSGRHRRDALTEALSRQHFVHLLDDEKRLSNSTRRPFALCLFDIDALRNVNDECGQHMGDAVVRELADRVRGVLDSAPWNEKIDLHARYDGGSMIVFLRGCSIDHGARFAEAVRSAVAARAFAGSLQISVSAGVASYRIGEPVDSTLTRVEQALYLAKQFGRDRVELSLNPADTGVADNLIPFPGPAERARSKAS